MKNKHALIGVALIVVMIMSIIAYIQIGNYYKKESKDIKERTNYFATYLLSYVTSSDNATEIVANLIDYEMHASFDTIHTPSYFLENFKEKNMIAGLNYILTFDKYEDYKVIFSKIREVIVQVAFGNSDEGTLFKKYPGGTYEKKINDQLYQYQIEKKVLSKKNWDVLWDFYCKQNNIGDHYFIDRLLKNPFIQVILTEQNIDNDQFKNNFDKIYKEIYRDIEPYAIDEIEKSIIDFCDFILKTKEYEKLELDTILLTYEFKWQEKIPNFNGIGTSYRTVLNLEDIYSTLAKKNYPMFYF